MIWVLLAVGLLIVALLLAFVSAVMSLLGEGGEEDFDEEPWLPARSARTDAGDRSDAAAQHLSAVCALPAPHGGLGADGAAASDFRACAGDHFTAERRLRLTQLQRRS